MNGWINADANITRSIQWFHRTEWHRATIATFRCHGKFLSKSLLADDCWQLQYHRETNVSWMNESAIEMNDSTNSLNKKWSIFSLLEWKNLPRIHRWHAVDAGFCEESHNDKGNWHGITQITDHWFHIGGIDGQVIRVPFKWNPTRRK